MNIKTNDYQIKSIEKYSDFYKEGIINKQIANKNKIKNDWYEALKFLFGKVFYRGRRDELSEKFEKRTIEVLNNFNFENFNEKLLDDKLKSNKVNNHKDRKMVLEVLDFVFLLNNYDKNIVKYTIDKIKKGDIKDVFDELNKIYCIGDKLSSFYLRDVIIIFQLKKYLKKEDFKYCQPVDIWVERVALKIGIINSEKMKREDIKFAIIKECLDKKVCPLLFNAGAWIVGAKSFDLLIDKL